MATVQNHPPDPARRLAVWSYFWAGGMAEAMHSLDLVMETATETQLRLLRRTTVGVCFQSQRQEAFPRHKELQRTVCCSLARLHLHLQDNFPTPQRQAVPCLEVRPPFMQVHLPYNQTRVGAREVETDSDYR